MSGGRGVGVGGGGGSGPTKRTSPGGGRRGRRRRQRAAWSARASSKRSRPESARRPSAPVSKSFSSRAGTSSGFTSFAAARRARPAKAGASSPEPIAAPACGRSGAPSRPAARRRSARAPPHDGEQQHHGERRRAGSPGGASRASIRAPSAGPPRARRPAPGAADASGRRLLGRRRLVALGEVGHELDLHLHRARAARVAGDRRCRARRSTRARLEGAQQPLEARIVAVHA